MTTISKLYYNGTGLEIMMTKEEMIEQANNGLKHRFQDGDTRDDIIANCLWMLKELEQDLFDKTKETGGDINAQIAMKHWGKDGVNKWTNWCFSIIHLLRFGILKDDDNNGWMTIVVPSESFTKHGDTFKSVKASKIFATCENCGIVGAFKKCAGCKKVHYCDGACQKSHWKIHKPNCGMN